MAVMVIALCVALFEHLLQLFCGCFIGALQEMAVDVRRGACSRVTCSAGHCDRSQVARSNPGRDATNNAESLDFSRFSAFFIFRHHSILTFPFCHRFCPVLAKKGERSC